jgi:hypothetical protein
MDRNNTHVRQSAIIPKTQNPEPKTQNPEPRTQNPFTVTTRSIPQRSLQLVRTMSSKPYTYTYTFKPFTLSPTPDQLPSFPSYNTTMGHTIPNTEP